MILFYQTEIPQGAIVLSPEESRHAIKVLRLKAGDRIDLTDGKGGMYECRITQANPARCEFVVVNSKIHPARKFRIHIAIAPTKNADRMEWFVEKAVEFGVDEISFILCKNSERRSINIDRIERSAISAMKQSAQAWLPRLTAVVPFKDILLQPADQKFIAHADQKGNDHLKSVAKPGGNYLVLIGPEGDFSADELDQATDAGFRKAGLGESRLRTETAGLAACHILNLIN